MREDGYYWVRVKARDNLHTDHDGGFGEPTIARWKATKHWACWDFVGTSDFEHETDDVKVLSGPLKAP